jgi:fucose permease
VGLRGCGTSSSKDVFVVPSFPLSCLAYLSVAVPGSTLGLLWPLMRLSWHQPLGLLGALLIIGVSASVLASVLTGRLMSRARTGPIVAAGAAAIALALAGESAAPLVWVFAGGMVVFGVGFGALDTALNAHAATRFGPRRINWMHASYGLGATTGPLLATGLLAAGLGWRGVFAAQAAVPAGRGLSGPAAAGTVSAYWATMFAGRAVLQALTWTNR